jgi:hypothetical protein
MLQIIQISRILQIFSEKPPKAYPASEVFCTPSSPLWKFRHHPKRTLVFQAPKLPHALQANYVARCGVNTWVEGLFSNRKKFYAPAGRRKKNRKKQAKIDKKFFSCFYLFFT